MVNNRTANEAPSRAGTSGGLNALLWVAKAEIPAGGVASTVTKADLDANLDPKPVKK